MEIAFLINTTSKTADEAFDLMKRTISKFVETHRDKKDNYQFIIHGEDSTRSDLKELERGNAKFPALHEDLKKADENFFKNSGRSTQKARNLPVHFVFFRFLNFQLKSLGEHPINCDVKGFYANRSSLSITEVNI